MTTAYTSLLGLALPVTGELSGTWGDTVNNSITSLLDSAIAGTTTLSADTTLTTTTGASNQARQAILLCTGHVANITITAPAQSKIYTVINASATYTAKIRGVGPTTGITIPVSSTATVAWNGSDFVDASGYINGNLKVNGTLTVTGTATIGGNTAVTGTLSATGAVSFTSANPSLSLGNGNASAGSLRFNPWTATNYNWSIDNGVITAGSLSITPSTAVGGNTYTTPVAAFSTTGLAVTGTLSATGVATFSAGTAALPAITTTGDTNTGIFFSAADTINFSSGAIDKARISSGVHGVFTVGTQGSVGGLGTDYGTLGAWGSNGGGLRIYRGTGAGTPIGTIYADAGGLFLSTNEAQPMMFSTDSTEKARITSGGNLLVGKTAPNLGVAGFEARSDGSTLVTLSGDVPFYVNRLTNDGGLVNFYQDTTVEGSISVSGTTVSYNGGHLSRWAQTTAPKDDSLVKGTVLSNLNEMNVYTDADGNPVDNEQLNKVKVSDVEGDSNVAGVFVNWSHDEDHDVDEINMAMTGDMIIRIAQGTTVARGDLLMSAGDGTAKPQGDDIVRSKTVAKVTSTHVTCTYADGSYCVPCVLMAC